MAKNKLTALAVKAAGDGKLFDGDGLTLVKKAGKGFWVYRYTHVGKRREMGLGSYPDVSLSDARKARDRAAGILASGIDPIAAREAERADALALRQKREPTFEEMTMTVFEAKKASLRGDGKRGRSRAISRARSLQFGSRSIRPRSSASTGLAWCFARRG